MRLHSHGFERRSLPPKHHTADQKHRLVKRVLLSKASHGQIYVFYCQKQHVVKRIKLSKASHGQTRHIVKSGLWSTVAHYQKHRIVKPTYCQMCHMVKRATWSNASN